MHYENHQDPYRVTTDPDQFDIDVIHAYLTRSYWKRGVPKAHVIRSLEHSLGFALLKKDQQIGFARVISDYVDYAYLCDVFVLEGHQGQGLGRWLIESVLACPGLQGLGQFTLITGDAQAFYSQLGFEGLLHPERHMQIVTRRPWYRAEP